MKFMLGTKGRMTQVFDEKGEVSAANDCYGWPAHNPSGSHERKGRLRSCAGWIWHEKEKNLNAAQKGHFKDLALFATYKNFPSLEK